MSSFMGLFFLWLFIVGIVGFLVSIDRKKDPPPKEPDETIKIERYGGKCSSKRSLKISEG